MEKRFIGILEKFLKDQSIVCETATTEGRQLLIAQLTIQVPNHEEIGTYVSKVVELEIKSTEDGTCHADLSGGTVHMHGADPLLAIQYFLCEKKSHPVFVAQTIRKKKFYQVILNVASKFWSQVVDAVRRGFGINSTIRKDQNYRMIPSQEL